MSCTTKKMLHDNTENAESVLLLVRAYYEACSDLLPREITPFGGSR